MKKIYILLAVIVILAAVLRIYRIDSVPPSVTWDEAAVGYNAFTIANWGKDEYGKSWPVSFKSFGEGKQPIHIYAAAFFVKLFGLSEFSTRIPVAVFGSLNVLIIYFLSKELFKNRLVGLLSSLFLALSPQNIFFSRFNHEANFVLFFFMLGFLLFLKATKGIKGFLPLSFLCFILSTISYNAAKVIVPPFVILVSLLYFKTIFKNRIDIFTTVFLLGVFILLSVINTEILGITRYRQTAQGQKEIEQTQIYKITQNYYLGRISLIARQYAWHFDPKFLFITGDKNPRLSAQYSSEFYYIDALFLITGLIFLIVKRSRAGLVLLGWAMLAPLPSSLVSEAPHAGRASFMMGSWQIISALGFYTLINFFKKPFVKYIVVLAGLVVLVISLASYLNYYFDGYPKRYAIDWQYGMKQIVEYIKDNPRYQHVFMTDARSQPYIFFLYYLQIPLPQYLNSVVYNRAKENVSYNTVFYFDKFYFGGWDPVESAPTEGVLYILTPSQYDGLRYKLVFQVKKIIYYPNGTTAYYIVSAS